MQFLKRHYEKIILCVVLLGLAGAAIWMGASITDVQVQLGGPVTEPAPSSKPLPPIDLNSDIHALAEVTNPPPVVLSGAHNLFNPVTWRRKPNGELLKILKTGPDALTITNIMPLYTVIDYDHPSPNGAIYIFMVQQHSGRKMLEYARKGEKTKSGLYMVVGTKGAVDNPDAIQLEIPETQETVWVSTNQPYKTVDGYTVDMRYDPDGLVLLNKRVGDTLTLDNEQYKIIDITNDMVRVQSINNTKVTSIKWNGKP